MKGDFFWTALSDPRGVALIWAPHTIWAPCTEMGGLTSGCSFCTKPESVPFHTPLCILAIVICSILICSL